MTGWQPQQYDQRRHQEQLYGRLRQPLPPQELYAPTETYPPTETYRQQQPYPPQEPYASPQEPYAQQQQPYAPPPQQPQPQRYPQDPAQPPYPAQGSPWAAPPADLQVWQQPYQRRNPSRRWGSRWPLWAAIAAVLVLVAGGAAYALGGHSPSSRASASSIPNTIGTAKSAATAFLAFYSAQQWSDAWQFLTPADKAEAPLATYVAVHQGCPARAAGLAYKITNATKAGKTAVITYTLAGAASAIGAATMTETWTPAGWTVHPNDMAVYRHGSVRADIAAAKAAGDCR